MAQFKAIDGFNSMDTKELIGYLYQLNEQLKYMFNNLTPEDNYSNQALQKYLEDEKRVASLKFDLDGLKVEVSDFEKNTNAKFEVTDSKIDMKVTKGTVGYFIGIGTGYDIRKSSGGKFNEFQVRCFQKCYIFGKRKRSNDHRFPNPLQGWSI